MTDPRHRISTTTPERHRPIVVTRAQIEAQAAATRVEQHNTEAARRVRRSDREDEGLNAVVGITLVSTIAYVLGVDHALIIAVAIVFTIIITAYVLAGR